MSFHFASHPEHWASSEQPNQNQCMIVSCQWRTVWSTASTTHKCFSRGAFVFPIPPPVKCGLLSDGKHASLVRLHLPDNLHIDWTCDNVEIGDEVIPIFSGGTHKHFATTSTQFVPTETRLHDFALWKSNRYLHPVWMCHSHCSSSTYVRMNNWQRRTHTYTL